MYTYNIVQDTIVHHPLHEEGHASTIYYPHAIPWVITYEVPPYEFQNGPAIGYYSVALYMYLTHKKSGAKKHRFFCYVVKVYAQPSPVIVRLLIVELPLVAASTSVVIAVIVVALVSAPSKPNIASLAEGTPANTTVP